MSVQLSVPASAMLRRNGGFVAIVGPVCIGHFCSHWFQYVLLPLFPLLQARYHVSYVELGALVSAFYIPSGLMQTPAGFVVDRLGAPLVLASGIGLLAVSFALMALAPPFVVLLPLAALAGLGNTVFHPSNFAILSNHIAPPLVGRAFSLHTLAGTLGYAWAPVAALGLAAAMSWQFALLVPAAIATGVAIYIATARHGLATPRSGAGGGMALATLIGALRQRPVLASFGYFMLSSLAGLGLVSALPLTLGAQFDVPAGIVAVAISASLVGSGVGTLAGGWLADVYKRHELVVVIGLTIAAAVLIAATAGPVPAPVLVGLLAVVGFATGITTPSRDMLIRAATTRTTTGRVFGFVYSGGDLGNSLTPIILGLLLDRHAVGWIIPVIVAGYAGMIGAALIAAPRRAT